MLRTIRSSMTAPPATRLRRRFAGIGALLVALVLAACGGGDGGGNGSGDAPFVGLAERLSIATGDIVLPPVEGAGAAESEDSAPTTGEARIGNTGGDGVALRSACQDGARAGGAWAEGTTIEVTELGSGECEGWSSGRAAGVTSWVRNDYLVGLEAAEGVPVALPGGPTVTLHGWFRQLLDGSGRVSLLARRSLGEPTPELTMTSLGYVVEDMESLATAAGGAGPFAGPCEQARAGLAEAAGTLADLAGGIRTTIEASGPAAALDGTTSAYIEQQEAAFDAFSSCVGA